MLENSKGVSIINNAIQCVENKFKGVDLSFVRPNKLNKFIEYSSVSELREDLFDLIDKESIEVSVFPIVGSSRIKWHSKTIEEGKVLIAILNSYEENGPYTFVGVTS